MPYPAETYVNQIADPATRAEFMQLYSLFQGYLSREHKDSGAHGAITADSAAIAGSLTFASGFAVEQRLPFRSTGGVFSGFVPTIVMGNGWFVQADGTDLVFANTGFDTGLTPNTYIAFVARLTSGTRVDIQSLATNPVNLSFKNLTAELAVTGATVSGSLLRLNLSITPAQITADQNNYAPTSFAGVSRVYLSSDAARNITGFSSANVTDGDVKWLINTGGFAITLKNDSASSSAGNKIAGPSAADVVIPANNGTVLIHYRSSIGYWYVNS